MAAQTQTAWTAIKSVGNQVVTSSTSTTDTANLCNFSLRTPDGIDCTKKYTLIVAASAAQDGAAAPIALYFSTADGTLALAGTTGRPTVTGGAEYGNIIDDLGYAAAVLGEAFIIDPESPVTDVVAIASTADGLKFRPPASKHHAGNGRRDPRLCLQTPASGHLGHDVPCGYRQRNPGSGTQSILPFFPAVSAQSEPADGRN